MLIMAIVNPELYTITRLYKYLCPWGNHEKRSGALKFGPCRLKGTGSDHQHQAKSSETQTYTVDLERADCFGRTNSRVVDTEPNPW